MVVDKFNNGLMLYQEDLMLCAREEAGFTMAEADLLRKGVGKKKKEIIDSLKPKFYDGCRRNGRTDEQIDMMWVAIEKAARYSWNKSHAVAYSLITYWTMYLLANYPVEYFAELLNGADNVGDTAMRRRVLLTECRRRGIKVEHPNINESENKYLAKDGKILLGLCGIKFVSDTVIEAIKEERVKKPFENADDFYNRLPHKICNKRTVEYLKMAGCFKEYQPSRQEEIESIGYSISGRIIDQSFRKYIREAGEIVELKETTTKKGDPMAFMTVDFHDEIRSIVVFPRQLAEYRDVLKKGNAFGFWCDGDILQKIFPIEQFEDFVVEIPEDKVDEFLTFCPKCNGSPNIYCGEWAVSTVNLDLKMFEFIEREFGVSRVRRK